MAEARWKATHIYVYAYSEKGEGLDSGNLPISLPHISRTLFETLNGKYCAQLDAGSDHDSEAADSGLLGCCFPVLLIPYHVQFSTLCFICTAL